jgi:tRNA-2-methylthio-N6-dimethylallyladenosine synthase
MKKTRLVSLPNLKEAAKRNPEEKSLVEKVDSKPTSFLVSWGQGKTFCIRTYGCQANVRDSEILRGYLLALGMKEQEEFLGADLILFNTCAIRENAENHLYGELGRAKEAYEKNPETIIGVCGCVMQEEFAVKYILHHFPFVSLIFGTNNLTNFYSLLDDCLEHNENIVDVRSNSDLVPEGLPEGSQARESKVTAFVNIMYGCNKFCTYCIVPFTRGRERSRKAEDILAEVNCLKEQGYKQVTLLGQNVDAYGKDFGDDYAFASLLEKVAQTGIERVRFVTPYPSDFRVEVFDVMAKYKNIMPFLHLPIQSGSNSVLKRMNRRYTREQYLEIVHQLRERLPDVFLSTDIIVGFPNETDEEFEETLSLVREVRYDAAYTFIFSPRPGTPAYFMKDKTPMEVKHKRFDALKALIDEQATTRANEFVGKDVEVLFEKVSEKDPSRISGYDPHNKLVHVKGDASLIGQIRKVHITESHTYSLLGELMDED